MHLSTYLLAILASLTAAAPHATQPCKAESWPSNSPGGPVPSSPSGLWEGTSTRCYTKMGTTSGLWNTATSWTTRYIPCTITSTSTATTTLTLAPTTATITVTSTGTTVGSTSFSTVIQGTTSTSTVDTTTTTVTTTTTTTTSTVFSTSTTTVAAPATFTPIQTSLPGSTYSGSGGSDPISKREVKARHHREQSSGLGLCQWHYPQGVTCHHWVPEKCSTTITTTTLTVTAWGQTVTTTSVSIVTTTSIPPGTVTATSTATTSTVSTITDTSTSTLTSTTTTYLSTTTLYAACASNNLAGKLGLLLSRTIDVCVLGPARAGKDAIVGLNPQATLFSYPRKHGETNYTIIFF